MRSTNPVVARALNAAQKTVSDERAVREAATRAARKIISGINDLIAATEGRLDAFPSEYARLYESVANFKIEVERLMAACR